MVWTWLNHKMGWNWVVVVVVFIYFYLLCGLGLDWKLWSRIYTRVRLTFKLHAVIVVLQASQRHHFISMMFFREILWSHVAFESTNIESLQLCRYIAFNAFIYVNKTFYSTLHMFCWKDSSYYQLPFFPEQHSSCIHYSLVFYLSFGITFVFATCKIKKQVHSEC